MLKAFKFPVKFLTDSMMMLITRNMEVYSLSSMPEIMYYSIKGVLHLLPKINMFCAQSQNNH